MMKLRWIHHTLEPQDEEKGSCVNTYILTMFSVIISCIELVMNRREGDVFVSELVPELLSVVYDVEH